MLKQALTDTLPQDTAVSVSGVSKIFTQWQRENDGKALLKKFFHPDKKIITALDDVSFTVKKGEFVAYAGPNGAGKSTTMKLLCGMLQPNEGEIKILGLSPEKDRIPLMHKLGVLFGNRTELWWDHPISQSFAWKKIVWDIPEDRYRRNLEMVTELLEIGPLLGTFTRELSLGQRMRADIAMMLLHSPQLILLDEPTLGLDVVAKRQMIDFLKKLNQESGVTILVTSHDMDDLEEMAERILMVSHGKIAYDGSFEGLREITGKLSRFVITAEEDTPPHIEGACLLSAKKGVFEYEADLGSLSVRSLLQQLSQIEGIKDIEIKKPPIEQVITQLYQSWR